MKSFRKGSMVGKDEVRGLSGDRESTTARGREGGSKDVNKIGVVMSFFIY